MENKITNYCSKNKDTHQICHPLHRQNTECTVSFGAPVLRDKHPGMQPCKTLQGWWCWEDPWCLFLPAICPALCLWSSETCALAREMKLAERGHLDHF